MRWLAALVFLAAPSLVQAQSPSPAQMGVTPTTMPEVLQVLDKNQNWVTIGSFAPGGPFVPVGGTSSPGGNCDAATGACTYLNVLDYGFKPGGVFDNSPQVASLIAAFPSSQSSNMDVIFPAIPGQIYTDYYFSQTFVVNRHMHIRCGGQVTGGDASTRLIFAPGVDGLFIDFPAGGGGISGCGIVNLGQSLGQFTSGSANVTGLTAFSAVGWHANDGVLAWNGGPPSTGPATPPGTTVVSVNPGASSLVMSNPAAYTGSATGVTGNGSPLWRLPAADAFSVTTSSGSPTVTITAGPTLMRTGSLVWSDAFPLGTTVRDISGSTVGAQTLTMGDVYLSGATVSATATHAAGSGKLWILPAAIHQNINFNKEYNYMAYFFSGEQRSCSTNTTPYSGCSGDVSKGNIMVNNVIGRYNTGSDTSPGISQSDVFNHNSFSDIVDATHLGDVYVGDVLNSAEAQSAPYNLVGNCSGNYPLYIQIYQGGPTSDYCMSGSGIGVAPVGTQNAVFIGAPGNQNNGALLMYDGLIEGPWRFVNTDGTYLCLNGGSSYIAGFIEPGQDCGAIGWYLQRQGGFWGWRYYTVSGSPMWFTNGTFGPNPYSGYTNGAMAFVDFHQGFLLYDTESGSYTPGSERLVDEGATIPVATFHKQGDVHFNQSAVPGGYGAWINTGAGASFRPMGPVANDTAGTRWTLGNYMTLTPVALASLPPTCSPGTFAVINNGVASPTYNAAVGSTTGAATDPVFCGASNNWTYH